MAQPAGQPQDGVVLLSWIPLGAGEPLPIVRWNGRLFEALVARHQHRAPCDLYHSALEVRLDGVTTVIEMTPVWGNGRGDRGVVGEGPVGARRLGRSRLFRYEVRRWAGGVVPDAAEAVGGPTVVSRDPALARRLLDLVPAFPTATWGRDELATGDMWNSNSLVSWLLVGAGVDTGALGPPTNGRAPGWAAGVTVASRLVARHSGTL